MPDSSTGYIKVVNDNRGKTCYCCPSKTDVRFVIFASAVKGQRLFLAICSQCLKELDRKHDALRSMNTALGRGNLR